MNSIRPLVTITILTLVGVFVYLNIKDGPTSTMDSGSAWNDTPGVPPLQTTTPGRAQTDGRAPPTAAPNWPATLPNDATAGKTSGQSTAVSATSAALSPWESSTPQLTTAAPSIAENDMTGPEPGALPEVPDIPELPPLKQPIPAAVINNEPTLPQNIPMARYPDEVPGPGPSRGHEDLRTESLPVVSGPHSTSAPVGTGVSSPGFTSADPRLTGAQTTPLPAPPAGPGSSAYALAKPNIQELLNRGDLSRAHLMLSQWLGDSTLTPADQQDVELLLSQLAGTVIYSTEHHLEPAHTVQAGESLETIANKYQVPWQLLGKINGIPRTDGVQLGRQIKVVRGPFMAIVRPSVAELTLLLEGRYAGKFSVSLPSTTTLGEGTWLVEKKLTTPGMRGVTQVSTAYVASTPVLDRVLVLRNQQTGATPELLTLGSNSSRSPMPAAGTPENIQLSPKDAEDIYDILSVGSRVVIRR